MPAGGDTVVSAHRSWPGVLDRRPPAARELTPDADGYIVDQSLASSGEYTGTIWCSGDPDKHRQHGPKHRRTRGQWVRAAVNAPGEIPNGVLAQVANVVVRPTAHVTYAPTPSGTFTVTGHLVPISAADQLKGLKPFDWGFSVSYTPAAKLPAGVKMPAGSKIVLVQAFSRNGLMGMAAHLNVTPGTAVGTGNFYNHQSLPGSGPYNDRPYGGPCTLWGYYTDTITVAADAQIASANGPY